MPQTLLPNIIAYIATIDPFDKLPQPLLEQVAAVIKITYLARGEQLILDAEHDGRYLYIIRTGAIEQRKTDGGLRAKLGAEDSFGFTFLEPIKNELDGYHALAIENTLLYMVPHRELKAILDAHPDHALHFAASAQQRLHSAMDVVWSNKDKGLFVRKVSDIASNRVAMVTTDMSIQAVAREMREGCRSSTAVVMQEERLVGVITDHDMTKRVVAEGIDISRPVSEVMTPSPLTIEPEDLVIKAVSLMMEHNVRSLPVVRNHQVVGLLTTSHLVHNHRVQAVFLIEKMKFTNSLDELLALTSERQAIFEALVEGRVSASVIGRVMALIMDAFNRRLIELAELQLGPAPCEYAWVVAGSHGRNEVHFTSDQDSALILADDATDRDKAYFAQLAQYVCEGMAACGYASCPGDYMASNAKWCQPIGTWQHYYRKWVNSPEYNQLLSVTVFLEMRTVYGQAQLCDQLQTHLHQLIAGEPRFLHALVKDSVTVHPPLGIFNKLVLEKGGEHSNTLNIKRYALTLMVDLARIYGLASGCDSADTEQRFAAAVETGRMDDERFKDVVSAFRFISQVRYDYQLKMLKRGLPADSHIAPDAFGNFERRHLKDAFRIIGHLQDAAKLRFSANG